MQSAAKFVLKMTATPDHKDTSTVKISLKEKDLNDPSKNDNKFLLKTTPEVLLKHDLEDVQMLEDAIENFKKIQAEYKTLGLALRPCMLLQVDNEPTDKEKKKTFLNNLETIKMRLHSSGLAWVKYFGSTDKDSNRVYKGDFTLDEITETNSEIDVVIFKIGPSTGWDIPRACMLVQLRNVCSSFLNAQTIGRIKRNPYPDLERNEITDKYYIYSNAPETDKTFKVYNYVVKEEFKNELFAIVTIANKKEITKSKISEGLKGAIEGYLKDNKDQITQQLNGAFIEKNDELVYKKVRYSVNGNEVYSTISNPFIFLKEYKRMINANKLIHDKLKDTTDKFFKQSLKDEKIGSSYNVLPEYFYTILFEKHKTELLNIINKYKQFKPTYQIDLLPYDPKSYSEIYDDKPKNTGKINLPSPSYLFDITSGGKDELPLDSAPEVAVFNKLCNFARDNPGKIKIWAKNLTSSNISGQYLDENKFVCQSFFDFVIKFENGVFLYIEVKSKNDIDKEKTKLLKTAYEDYFAKSQKTLFDNLLIVSVWQVDGSEITRDTFYDKTNISENLNNSTVVGLLETISNLNLNAIVK